MKSLFRIADGTLVPDEDRAIAWLRRQKTEFVQVEHTGVRSPQQLKLYWKLLNKAFDTLPEGSAIATVEHLHARLKCSLGFCTEIRKKGLTIQVPESIGLGNMESDAFNQFFDAAQKLLAETLGVTVDDLESEDERMMGGI